MHNGVQSDIDYPPPPSLFEQGWYLRQDDIWSKPNCMPESCEDRCTKAHEYLFQLTKGPRYFFDHVAIQEPVQSDRAPSRKAKPSGAGHKGLRPNGTVYDGTEENRNRRSVWTVASMPFSGEFCAACKTYFEGSTLKRLKMREVRTKVGPPEKRRICSCGKDDGWVAHFAVFPPDLIEPCIKAGTSEFGCCSECAAPFERVTEKSTRNASNSARAGRSTEDINAAGKWSGDNLDGNKGLKSGPVTTTRTIGFRATCKCAVGLMVPKPCTVLDPFGGAGTTAMTADRLHRNAILIELNPNYAEMARQRMRCDSPLFAEVT